MKAPTVSVVVLCFVFGGALVGMFLRRYLPRDHFSAESYRVIVSSTGLVITIVGIVVGMLVNAAKNTFDTTQNQISQFSSSVVMLDSLLAAYGPAAQGARSQLRTAVQTGLERIWPQGQSRVQVDVNESSNELDGVYRSVLALAPTNDEQAMNKAQAIRVATDLSQLRWLLLVKAGIDSPPVPLIVILTSWLTAIFITFGLFVPPANSTVVVVLFFCAAAVSAAIFIIIQMNNPLEGILTISGAPLRAALKQLGK